LQDRHGRVRGILYPFYFPGPPHEKPDLSPFYSFPHALFSCEVGIRRVDIRRYPSSRPLRPLLFLKSRKTSSPEVFNFLSPLSLFEASPSSQSRPPPARYGAAQVDDIFPLDLSPRACHADSPFPFFSEEPLPLFKFSLLGQAGIEK